MADPVEEPRTAQSRLAMWALGVGAVLAVSPLIVVPAVQTMALQLPPQEGGRPAIDTFDVYFYSFALLVPIAAILALASATERGWVTGCALGVVGAFLFLGAFLGGDMIADTVRMRAFGSLAERSRPLIAAISAYQQDHQRPPGDLRELVPSYLPNIPQTGLRFSPSYAYVVGDKARDERRGNPWALVVEASSGWLSYDQFVYYPLGNYAGSTDDHNVERIGEWAYLRKTD